MLLFSSKSSFQVILLLFVFSIPIQIIADVVKPALIEISVNKTGAVDIEIRASIEALLTGINGQYKTTKDAPNANEYEVLREMKSDQLLKEFDKFKQHFLEKIILSDNSDKKIALTVGEIRIPEPGYTKVPRISVVKVHGKIKGSVTSLIWYYPLSFGDHAVRLRQVDDIEKKYHWSEWQWLRKDKPSEVFSLTEIVAQKSPQQTIAAYILLGFEHILPKGLDHILFIMGLFLFAAKFKPLLWQVTMFTVAHTITLALAMNDIINLPANIVEPLITLSIAYIGIENVFSNRLKNSRLLLVFIFGLLHGLGFASVLTDFGLPQNSFIVALISFNVGVELGQVAIILVMFLSLGLWFRQKSWYRKFITIPASLLIAMIAFYWFLQRLEVSI